MDVRWRDDTYQADPVTEREADAAIEALRRRGSPSHDGLAARLADYDTTDDRLRLELQPARWSLRLVGARAAGSFSASCIVRSADGRWLAGHRAGWLASWADRWALGAAGSVEVDEHPADTMHRELEEEWSVQADRLQTEALVELPSGVVLLLGQAWLPEGATVTPDDEHDDYAWWPADVARWPEEADEPLRIMAGLVTRNGA
jgi:8-oxo-dGTP pyrophosphatase MutT (NUDIX family)